MDNESLKKYCELIIEVGINLYPDQCLNISCGVKDIDFAVMLAGTAYSKGAKYVDFQIHSNKAKRFRIEENINSENLSFIPNYLTNKSFEILANDWAYISIDNIEEIDELKSVDSSKFTIMMKKEQETFRRQSISFGASKNTWCVVAAPGAVWASKVLKSGASVDELWAKLIPVLRLDKENPVKEWKELAINLVKRSDTLTKMKLNKLIFTGPGTNLEIGLIKNSLFKGGHVKAANGRMFIPNIPTEEVFTTPDFKRTNGKVKVTKPVKVLENLLTGIWFEFKDGKVINFGADSGKEILEKYLTIDEGASYLGEVALVDKNSEVHKSGLIFNSILYDENAACHIALGRGITNCLINRDELNTPEEMKKNGCNYSLVHTDFMIGSEEINVDGIDQAGKKTEIIKNGEFKI
ncbi:MAG: aminopeptidase [Bacteroidota bacterium]|nr:aminopeptidase [Bacteroidota bacterium]